MSQCRVPNGAPTLATSRCWELAGSQGRQGVTNNKVSRTLSLMCSMHSPQSDRNQRKIAEFASHCDRISQENQGVEGSIIMSAQIRQPIGSIGFVSALLVLSLSVSVPVNTARAADCLSAPNSSAPENSRWYYRTDRMQQRKCWHLGAANQPPQQGAAQTARETALAKPSQSVPAVSPSNLSHEDVEKLYAEFLEWSRHAKDPGKEHQ